MVHFEDFVGRRYLMAKRDRNMLSVITLISIGGVAVGVMALIVVLSVMGGFEADFREKIIGSKSHVVISAVDGYLENYGEIRDIARSVDHVEGVNVFVEAEVMLNSPTNLQAAILRGVDYREITTTTKLAEYMENGKLEYLESPESLPSVTTAMGYYQQGTVAVHLESAEEPTPERKQQMAESGARSAVAFTGSKHGDWMAKDAGGVEVPEKTGDDGALLETLAAIEAEQPVVEPVGPIEMEPEPSGVDPELLALIGEDRWVDAEPSTNHRQPQNLGLDEAVRQPNAELYPQQVRTRQMKPLPGLGAEDIGNRKVGAIILGRELRKNLALNLGGELNVMSPSGDLGPTGGMPKSRPFKLVGTYYSGMFDFDAKMGYLSLADAQSLLGIGDRVSGLDVRCTRLEDSQKVRDELRAKLAGFENVKVDDWRTLNASLFGAIMLEKVAMFTILTSIILVASFNILCLLIMMVIEKAREIAIFKAMGTTDRSIVRIFVVQGAMIGGLGTVIGLVLGLGLCFIITHLGLKMPGNVHYITQIPVTIEPLAIVLICLASIGISLLATVLPSRMAVKLKAVDGLRCE